MNLGLPILEVLFIAALPSLSASAVPPALVSDRDTVAGIEAGHWDPNLPWLRPNFIRIQNTTAHTLFLDSLRIPSDSVGDAGSAQPLQVVFASRKEGSIRTYLYGIQKSAPITLPVGDSIDLGLFEIGRIGVLVKTSASSRRYRMEDSIIAPLALFAGAESIRFVLKAKIKGLSFGDAIVPIRTGRRGVSAEGWTATADGRAASEAQPKVRILFKEDGRGASLLLR